VAAAELDSMVATVAGHKKGVTELKTATEKLREGLGTETMGCVRYRRLYAAILALVISISSYFWTPSAARAQELPTPAAVIPGTGGSGQGNPNETSEQPRLPTVAPVTPEPGGSGQEDLAKTPEPQKTPEPTIQVTAVTVSPTAITVKATVTEPVPPTAAPVTPSPGGGEQGTPTPTETPPPTSTPTPTPPPATITMIIPSPTATPPPTETPTTPPATPPPPTETPTTPPATPPPPTETPRRPDQPPTETPPPTSTPRRPDQPPTETPPPTSTPPPAIVIIQTPTGQTIEFTIPTATVALLRQPRVEHADTSGAVPDSERAWSSQVVDLLELAPFALLIATSILGFAYYRSKKQ